MKNFTFKVYPNQGYLESNKANKNISKVPRLAHAYVPCQYYNVIYSTDEALCKGTIFPELVQPQGTYGPCEGREPCYTYFPEGGVPYGC